jgi:proline iminopeptidase
MSRAVVVLILMSQVFCMAQEKQSHTSHVNSNGVDITYKVKGDGIPVLIINGGPGFNSLGFQPLADKISEMGVMTILFDQRGTGQSKMNNVNADNMTLSLMVDDIEAIRKDLGIKQWVILGHSFGGMLGAYYTAMHKERVMGLILSSSGGLDLSLLGETGSMLESKLAPADVDSLRFWRRSYAQSQDTTEQKKYHYFLSKAYVKSPKYYDIVAERLGQGNMQINRLIWQNMQAINYDLKHNFLDFNAPVLILQGEDDILSPNIAQTANRVFQNSRLIFLKNTAHYGWLDNPIAYFTSIRAFLNQPTFKS